MHHFFETVSNALGLALNMGVFALMRVALPSHYKDYRSIIVLTCVVDGLLALVSLVCQPVSVGKKGLSVGKKGL